MRVFVTGATGFIGSAVVRELIGAGHKVLGLARSDAGAKSLAAAGAEVHRGDLEDLDSLRSGAAMSDGVIHTAFIHDFSKFKETLRGRPARHRGAWRTRSPAPTAPWSSPPGPGCSTPGRIATEDDAPPPVSILSPRLGSDGECGRRARRARLGGAPRALGPWRRRSRLRSDLSSPSPARRAFRPISARDSTAGRRCTASMRRISTGSRSRRASAGASYHGVAEEGVPTREIAEVIGRRLNLPVVSESPAEAAGHFGFFGISSARTCRPRGAHAGLLGLEAHTAGADCRSRPAPAISKAEGLRSRGEFAPRLRRRRAPRPTPRPAPARRSR